MLSMWKLALGYGIISDQNLGLAQSIIAITINKLHAFTSSSLFLSCKSFTN